MNERLKEKHIQIKLTSRAKEQIINDSYDERYGARPMKRYVARQIETLLASNIISGEVKPKDVITIDYQNNIFLLTK